MALYDPKTIRLEQRQKANRATINGVSLLPLSKTLEMAKKIVDGREILDSIRTSGQLDADTEKKLKALLDQFSQRFS